MWQFMLSVALIYIGFSLAHKQIVSFFIKIFKKDQQENPNFLEGNSHFFRWLDYIAITTFCLGCILFIAPTPTLKIKAVPEIRAVLVTYRFIGDFFPALTLVIASIATYKKILSFFALPEAIDSKIQYFTERYRFFIGIASIIFGFVHLVYGNSNLV